MIWDMAIVGGGPAGLATAIAARQRGLTAVLLDKRTLPTDKACGEGLMPPGVTTLAELGVELAPHHRASFVGIRYVDGATVAEGRFSSPGWGVRRTRLSAALLARARALGADIREHSAVRGWRERADRVEIHSDAGALEARLLVGADGLHSRVRRQAGIEASTRGRARFGIRRHFRIPPWSPFVEVHWHRHAEAYITPVDGGQVGVALLCPGDGRRFKDILSVFPQLAERLRNAEPVSEVRGAGPFRQKVPRRVSGRVVLVGDAAGYLDALTGEGVTLALRCGQGLAELVARKQPLAAYESLYRRETRAYYTMTELLLQVAARPAFRARVVQGLARNPEIFDRFLAINMGELPLRALGVGNMTRLLLDAVR